MGHGSFYQRDVEKRVTKGMEGQFASLILHFFQKEPVGGGGGACFCSVLGI
jgi:hypothetical protein